MVFFHFVKIGANDQVEPTIVVQVSRLKSDRAGYVEYPFPVRIEARWSTPKKSLVRYGPNK